MQIQIKFRASLTQHSTLNSYIGSAGSSKKKKGPPLTCQVRAGGGPGVHSASVPTTQNPPPCGRKMQTKCK